MSLYPTSKAVQPCHTKTGDRGSCNSSKCWFSKVCMFHISSWQYYLAGSSLSERPKDKKIIEREEMLQDELDKKAILAGVTKEPEVDHNLMQLKSYCDNCGDANINRAEACHQCGNDLILWKL